MGKAFHVRENATSETVRRKFEFPDDELATFMFGDGNYACDCNRTLFFHYNYDDIPCSDDLFTVWLVDGIGTIVYDER